MTRVILDEFGALDRIYDRANILILGNNRFPIYFSNSGQHLERMACDQIGRVFYLDERKKYFVNPGSLSQNECTDIPGTFTYAILHFNDDVVSLKFRRGKYDLNAYLKELETRGYPTQYINNFRIGG